MDKSRNESFPKKSIMIRNHTYHLSQTNHNKEKTKHQKEKKKHTKRKIEQITNTKQNGQSDNEKKERKKNINQKEKISFDKNV